MKTDFEVANAPSGVATKPVVGSRPEFLSTFPQNSDFRRVGDHQCDDQICATTSCGRSRPGGVTFDGERVPLKKSKAYLVVSLARQNPKQVWRICCRGGRDPIEWVGGQNIDEIPSL